MNALVVDDEPLHAQAVEEALRNTAGGTDMPKLEQVMVAVPTTAVAVAARLAGPLLLFLDWHCPTPDDGRRLLVRLAQQSDSPVYPVVVSGRIGNPNDALTAGAKKFVHKGAGADELGHVLHEAAYWLRQEEARRRVSHRIAANGFEVTGLETQVEQLTSFSMAGQRVLLYGETGTGKEEMAKLFHAASPYHAKDFVQVNCGSIPPNLADSHLFGHEKGAFTGATSQRIGLVETADGRVLFLDELQALAPDVQTKLLDWLQNKRFRRVGGTAELSSNPQVVCATTGPLSAEDGFLTALYFRLGGNRIDLPPLRDRKTAMSVLVDAQFRWACREIGRLGLHGLTSGAKAQLVKHSWAGNVRHLKNALLRAVTLAHGPEVTEADLGDLNATDAPAGPSAGAIIDAVRMLEKAVGPAPTGVGRLDHLCNLFEATVIQQAMQEANNNKSEAAKRLGLTAGARVTERIKRLQEGQAWPAAIG